VIDGKHFPDPDAQHLTEAVARLEAARWLLDYALQGRLEPAVAAQGAEVLARHALAYLRPRVALGAILRARTEQP
jgi:hypothetical protein